MRSSSPDHGSKNHAPGQASGSQDHCRSSDHCPGRLIVLGLGPGQRELLAPMAHKALATAQAIVGYDRYVDLVDPELLVGKTVFSSPMTKELERTAQAVDYALQGLNTVVVSSGDSGIYGMAGLVLEYLERKNLDQNIELEIIPGIPALAATAALLGAPLMHDFASISLSDLMTPLELIMRRAQKALEADFVLVLYNPRSRKRHAYLSQVLDMALDLQGPETPIGFVRNAYRPDQEVRVATLKTCDPEWADMLTTIIIGNSNTRLVGQKMLTPRGYFEKYHK